MQTLVTHAIRRAASSTAITTAIATCRCCGRHLLAAKLRRSKIDAAAGSVEEMTRIIGQIRARWPRMRILLCTDSGFCREELMAWCEANRVDDVFGLARNDRLVAEIEAELAAARAETEASGKRARRVQGLPLVDTGQLEPHPARHRQGGVDTRRGQSPLHRHLAADYGSRRAVAVRNDLLRAWRDGEPYQGMPARPVR